MSSSLLSAKARTVAEQSDAIVVSFAAHWRKPLLQQSFNAVIRKRIPRTLLPKWLYFHINSPISAICARAQIESCQEISIEAACMVSGNLALSEDEVRAYADGSPTIGCYRLKTIARAAHPVSSSELAQRMKYYAPQSFFILSKAARSIVDELASFESSELSQ